MLSCLIISIYTLTGGFIDVEIKNPITREIHHEYFLDDRDMVLHYKTLEEVTLRMDKQCQI